MKQILFLIVVTLLTSSFSYTSHKKQIVLNKMSRYCKEYAKKYDCATAYTKASLDLLVEDKSNEKFLSDPDIVQSCIDSCEKSKK